MNPPQPVVGYGFRPTDEELVAHYLRLKIDGFENEVSASIREIDVCRLEPWDLPDLSLINTNKDKQWFFYCRNHQNGQRSKRATEAGYWKSTGNDRCIRSDEGVEIGRKKTLVFYRRRSSSGAKRTHWLMHEYRATVDAHSQGGYVLCRLFNKHLKRQDAKKPDEDSNSNAQNTSSAVALKSPVDYEKSGGQPPETLIISAAPLPIESRAHSPVEQALALTTTSFAQPNLESEDLWRHMSEPLYSPSHSQVDRSIYGADRFLENFDPLTTSVFPDARITPDFINGDHLWRSSSLLQNGYMQLEDLSANVEPFDEWEFVDCGPAARPQGRRAMKICQSGDGDSAAYSSASSAVFSRSSIIDGGCGNGRGGHGPVARRGGHGGACGGGRVHMQTKLVEGGRGRDCGRVQMETKPVVWSGQYPLHRDLGSNYENQIEISPTDEDGEEVAQGSHTNSGGYKTMFLKALSLLSSLHIPSVSALVGLGFGVCGGMGLLQILKQLKKRRKPIY